MPYVAGVDLGTTYSAAAIFGPGGALAVDLDTRTMVVPSVVAVRADGEILTGAAAERRLVLEPSRVACEFKRRLGDPAPLLLGGVPYGAETLMGHLLKAILDRVAEREGEPPALVALSHPANYGRYKLGLLEEAARVAEISAPVFVPEPVAASAHYSQTERVTPGSLIAVYDLGGGTFDASVVRRTDEGFEVVGRPDGMDRFGGIDMDEAVLGHVRSVLGDELFRVDDRDPAVMSALAHLREECRRAKEVLSDDTEAAIPVMLPGLHTEVRVTRAELEDMIRPRIRETISVLERTVASAGVEIGDIARVLLVGGSSRIPLVGEMVRQATGRPVGVDVHPKLTTALGTARVAHAVVGHEPPRDAPTAPAREVPPEPERRPEPVPATAGTPTPLPPEGRAEREATGPIPVPGSRWRGRAWRLAAAAAMVAGAVVGGILVFGGGNGSTPQTTDAAGEPERPGTATEAPDLGTQPAGGEASDRVLGLYQAWYASPEYDDRWWVWDGGGSSPPDDICCDYYPALGPYSSNDPEVLDQHFAWFEQAGIGIVGYEWWGPDSSEDRLVPLVLTTADRHGLDVAFVIREYETRSVAGLADDIAYLYERHGDEPAFYRTEGGQGLFLLWAPAETGSAATPGSWRTAVQAAHELPDGAVLIAGSVDAQLVRQDGFDGLVNRPEPAPADFAWAVTLPEGAWFVPTVSPGFEQEKSLDDGPRVGRDDGATFSESWQAALSTGVEPALVVVGSFNDWTQGTQIEPAAGSASSGTGFDYRDYGSLGREGYLDLTAELVAELVTSEPGDVVPLQLSVTSTADWVSVSFEDATWVRPTEVSLTGEGTIRWDPVLSDSGVLSVNVEQSITTAEAGDDVQLVMGIGLIPGASDAELVVTQGCLGVSVIDVYDQRSGDRVEVARGAGPAECGGRATIPVPVAGWVDAG